MNSTKNPKRYLIIADLHIGFEQQFRGSGVRIESSIEGMASELESIIEGYRITDLIVNGDLKSGIDRILDLEWENVPRFLSRLSRMCRVFVIPGNHDGGIANLLPQNVVLEDMNGMLIEDALILHGHTRPLVKYKECKRLIIGHVHPILRKKGSPLSGRPVWAFLKIPKKVVFREMLEELDDSLLEVIVMPSFNLELSYAGYKVEDDLDDRKSSSLARDLKLAEEAIIITLNGEVIGEKSVLANIL